MSFRDIYKWCKKALVQLIKYAAENIFFFGVALFAIAACSVVFGALYQHFFRGADIPVLSVVNQATASYWGQLGDFAGGFLNPLLSFLALMAVLKTMALQRAEMKAAQQEAKIATQEQRQQTAVYSRQMFESTLFGMLDTHAKILADIKYSNMPGKISEGRDAIDLVVREFKSFYKDSAFYSPPPSTDSEVRQNVSSFCKSKVSVFGHYFRNLYWIMKMIDNSQNTEFDFVSAGGAQASDDAFYADYCRKRNYTNIVRAQLSESEMALLQINCLGPHGEDLKYYVEYYSMLKPLGKEFFGAWSESMTSSFNDVAFVGLEKISNGDLKHIKNIKSIKNLGVARSLLDD